MRSGDRIRITAQLIDANRDEHIWARTYDRTTRDVLGLQAEVAAAIVGEVKGVAAAQRSRRRAGKAVNPAAYDLYLRGRHAWNERAPQGLADAARYFDEAIRQDPGFALAHAGLADVYQLSSGAAMVPDAPAKARASAQRALELDKSLAEAHTSLAGVLHRVDRDLSAAESGFKRALYSIPVMRPRISGTRCCSPRMNATPMRFDMRKSSGAGSVVGSHAPDAGSRALLRPPLRRRRVGRTAGPPASSASPARARHSRPGADSAGRPKEAVGVVEGHRSRAIPRCSRC